MLDGWQEIEADQIKRMQGALWHLLGNAIAYLSLFVIELVRAMIGHSQSLHADAFNNFAGIVSSGLLSLGIWGGIHNHQPHQSKVTALDGREAERRNRLMRFRLQDLFTLMSGVIMLVMAVQVIVSGVSNLFKSHTVQAVSGVTVWGAAIASIVMLVVWYFNRRGGQQLDNSTLLAAAKDSLSDALTSIGTLISLSGVLLFKFAWLDSVASIVIGFFIFAAGLQIFWDSGLQLINYSDPKVEKNYINTIQQIDGVNQVNAIDVQYSGSLVALSLVIAVSPRMTVAASFQLSERIEQVMRNQYGIIDTKVMFMPQT
ncbi:cation diffusion facilitator family transporter [Lactiplantibacillus plantarum]|uniref:cation diffusion facilitator family transporter n=1 Tax=Lactiplantibacillus plantarum TaxID=1590 RepID=UPI00108209E3|nr:cation diffusion facilitator family transporter [Lactiplantibacillus plantarum]QBX93198.1 cation transporter [Lactiplantibacillus plantarum]